MLKKETDTLKAIAEELSTDERILRIVAFGSRVRGDHREDSDLDVLVIVDKKGREVKEKIVNAFYVHELETGISLSPVIFSLEDLEINKKLGSPFFDSIRKEGIVLYDSERRGEEVAFEISS